MLPLGVYRIRVLYTRPYSVSFVLDDGRGSSDVATA